MTQSNGKFHKLETLSDFLKKKTEFTAALKVCSESAKSEEASIFQTLRNDVKH